MINLKKLHEILIKWICIFRHIQILFENTVQQEIKLINKVSEHVTAIFRKCAVVRASQLLVVEMGKVVHL